MFCCFHVCSFLNSLNHCVFLSPRAMQTFLNLKFLLVALFVFLVCAEPENVVFFTKSLQGLYFAKTANFVAQACNVTPFLAMHSIVLKTFFVSPGMNTTIVFLNWRADIFWRSKFFAKKFVPSSSNAILPRFVTFEPSKLEYENTYETIFSMLIFCAQAVLHCTPKACNNIQQVWFPQRYRFERASSTSRKFLPDVSHAWCTCIYML